MSSFEGIWLVGQPRERVDGVDVGPLQILEDEDEGQIVGEGGERGAKLVEHPDGVHGRRAGADPLREEREPRRRVLRRECGARGPGGGGRAR